ncbi:hypothetical protein [Pelagerythrobacter marinus]|uniref:hypothetical protein n=1 Tax=Pelagerythrobacter marinus TaxID=538382 RepID=UPI0020367C6B|nr:hypothetical protein [Pelagerythrobacter marinus]USA38532.1 hypothetical protein NCF86_09335 [Pelagerythrobacter marinus]WPZ07442.1 hypothetical protein T8T98_02705 [Pelagerythrobacter marinus]
MALKTESLTYRRHIIRSACVNDQWQARIFRGKNTVGDVFHGVDRQQAILSAQQAIDNAMTAENAVRQSTGAPSVNAYFNALKTLEPLPRHHLAMLEAHLGAPGYLMTATELAKAAGWTDYSAANLHYGNLGYELSQELEWAPPKREDGTPVWTMVLATEPDVAGELIETTDFQWKLRPQIIEALNMFFGKSEGAAVF